MLYFFCFSKLWAQIFRANLSVSNSFISGVFVVSGLISGGGIHLHFWPMVEKIIIIKLAKWAESGFDYVFSTIQRIHQVDVQICRFSTKKKDFLFWHSGNASDCALIACKRKYGLCKCPTKKSLPKKSIWAQSYGSSKSGGRYRIGPRLDLPRDFLIAL